jgi:hypothetical protein
MQPELPRRGYQRQERCWLRDSDFVGNVASREKELLLLRPRRLQSKSL